MEVVVSVISLMVIVTVTGVLLYQNASVRDQVTSNMQNVVDQINDATYYSYQYDKKQEGNIKNLDQNVNTIAKDLNTVIHNVKAIQTQVPTTNDISHMVKTQNVQTGILNLGNKFSLSGVGDTIGNDDTLRLMDREGKTLYGQFAANKLYADTGATLRGETMADSLSANNVVIPGSFPSRKTRFGVTANEVSGNLTVLGNLDTTGNIIAGALLETKEGISMQKTTNGPLFENTGANGDKMGLGYMPNNEMRMYNTSATGSFGVGYSNAANYESMLSLSKNSGKSLKFADNLELGQVQTGTGTNPWSSLSSTGDLVMKTGAANKLFIQNGASTGIALSNNSMGIGVLPDPKVRLDVSGGIAARGNEVRLGYKTGIDTKDSRALYKHTDGQLYINYQKDFAGTNVDSDLYITNPNCIHLGKGDAQNKTIDNNKLCYQNNTFNVHGAGAPNAKTVNVYDNMVVQNKLTAKGQLCVNQACVDETTFNNRFKQDAICINNKCLTETDISNVINLGNVLKTSKVTIGNDWSLYKKPGDSLLYVGSTAGGEYTLTPNVNKAL